MNETDPHFFPAMRQALNRLKLAEDWCDMFENVVDMSEITRFGDGPTVRPHLPGMVDPGTAYSRALIYPAQRPSPTSMRSSCGKSVPARGSLPR